jgi:ABC-type phosphate transport system substrate-binding protein
VKASDQEVAAFVGANPGAIGYVSAETTLPGNTKVLKVTH